MIVHDDDYDDDYDDDGSGTRRPTSTAKKMIRHVERTQGTLWKDLTETPQARIRTIDRTMHRMISN